MSNVKKANTEKLKRDKYTWLNVSLKQQNKKFLSIRKSLRREKSAVIMADENNNNGDGVLISKPASHHNQHYVLIFTRTIIHSFSSDPIGTPSIFALFFFY